MPNTLEGVIDYCINTYGLEVMPHDRNQYLDALKRHPQSINGCDLNTSNGSLSHPSCIFQKHLADYLILYSYLAGLTPIILGKGKKKKIQTYADLKLLSMQNVGASSKRKRTDLLLARTYGRIQQRNYDHDFPTTPEIFDQIGRT
jgi:hypothetical protein